MKVLQINVTNNSGSHGRMASDIGNLLIREGHESYIAYGRSSSPGNSHPLKIGTETDIFLHAFKSRISDRHGFGSERATKKAVEKFRNIEPDIIHLHNIHGYFINVRVLFNFIKSVQKPVVWTFHDCWPFTGHCSHFQRVGCEKWKVECKDCPLTGSYPRSWFIDNSTKNFHEKREIFGGLKNIILVSPSDWLSGHLQNSFLSGYKIRTIRNGISPDVFKPAEVHTARVKYNIRDNYVLGIANVWSNLKGLGDFIKLRRLLDPSISIVLVGLSERQITNLPEGMKGVSRTENTNELAELYSGALALVNPTYVDNFPSVNIESLACGTPVITYDTGGSPESIDKNTGIVVNKGNIEGLLEAIYRIGSEPDKYSSELCRERAISNFSAEERLLDYIRLYEGLVSY